MGNLTISVDDEVLKRARIRALEENTSVNAVLGGYLRDYAYADEVQRNRLAALESLLILADENPIDRGDRRWSREELYERRSRRGCSTCPSPGGVGVRCVPSHPPLQ